MRALEAVRAQSGSVPLAPRRAVQLADLPPGSRHLRPGTTPNPPRGPSVVKRDGPTFGSPRPGRGAPRLGASRPSVVRATNRRTRPAATVGPASGVPSNQNVDRTGRPAEGAPFPVPGGSSSSPAAAPGRGLGASRVACVGVGRRCVRRGRTERRSQDLRAEGPGPVLVPIVAGRQQEPAGVRSLVHFRSDRRHKWS